MPPLQQWEVVAQKNPMTSNASGTAFSSIDERTEDHEMTAGRNILELSVCACKYCYRLIRNQDYHRQVLCDDHKMGLSIAVADIFCDWFHKDIPTGLTPSSSIRIPTPRPTIRRSRILNESSRQIRGARIREPAFSARASRNRFLYGARFTEDNQGREMFITG